MKQIGTGCKALQLALVIGFMLSPIADARAAATPATDGVAARASQLRSGGCEVGLRHTLSGECVRDVAVNRHCQPGMHAVSFPKGSGYRCVRNHAS
jgi:hypothetical protein